MFLGCSFQNSRNQYLKKKNNTSAKVLSGCPQPAYEGRLDWCPDGSCPKSNSPSAINPTHIVVHHSAGQTTSSDFAAVVRSYWDLHVNTNGWADIGYNWLIDPNGMVYEGRGDRVRGAHSPCMNAVATGICFIGNYDTYTPSANGLSTLEDFIAWDATDKNIDVEASSYASSLGAVIDNVSGHKDGYTYNTTSCTNTACPGTNLHSLLPSIRSNVAAYPCYISSANAPDTPLAFGIIRSGNTSVEIKISPVATATLYGVYKSSDNVTFQKITESALTTIPVTGLTQGQVYYFKIEAINNDGTSDLSEVLAAIPSQYASEFLIIDGVERRATNANFDAIEQYEYPFIQLGRTFSSATNDAIMDGLINLNVAKFTIWMLLDESTADETFTSAEQTLVTSFINNDDGIFIVSGNEVGWDLARGTQSTAADKSFYNTVLKADYIADNPTPHNYLVRDTDNTSYNLIQNPNDILDGRWPDLIKPLNGSANTFTYDGVSTSTGVAGVGYFTSQGGVEYLPFAIESIENDTQRKNLLEFVFDRYASHLGLTKNLTFQNISLYPNPTTGIIRITNPASLELTNATIHNALGQQIKRVKIKSNSIDLSELKSGIYFVKIEDDNNNYQTYKIVKTD
ncbi:MAG: N-acetylmuramoyl-L-alanine amidase [Urechidicola sp.]|nr:N-acetylmuramoyl-L-alanine amidase [Urechidicola sp.]